MRSFGPALLVLSLALHGLLPSSAFAQMEEAPTPPPPPGQGGDAELPAGFKNVRWGINPYALQAVLGRGMESAPDVNEHLTWLIDTPPTTEEGPGRGVVKFRFWDERLMEVRIFYTGFEATDGKHLVEQFEREHGPADHEVITQGTGYPPVQSNVEERWTWQDPFTVQILRRDIRTEAWSCVRQSRVLEEGRAMQEIREREEKRQEKIRKAME